MTAAWKFSAERIGWGNPANPMAAGSKARVAPSSSGLVSAFAVALSVLVSFVSVLSARADSGSSKNSKQATQRSKKQFLIFSSFFIQVSYSRLGYLQARSFAFHSRDRSRIAKLFSVQDERRGNFYGLSWVSTAETAMLPVLTGRSVGTAQPGLQLLARKGVINGERSA
ncbi:hypothetical protein [Rhabdochromatium marinum]|uniref:hypothetical protein n=1 Tax=Rhabdochromatium marinum TaxID=48729 RepID=UPI001F5BEAD7|nr:hypothetical protein [Rhabdochromatium marinum]